MTARSHDFRGQNVETPPYPPAWNFSRFGTVSDRTHGQALSGLSRLSYSPAVFTVRRLPPQQPTTRGHPRARSPRPPRLQEPHETRTRIARRLRSPAPWTGFGRRTPPSPALNHRGLSRLSRAWVYQVFLCRPRPRGIDETSGTLKGIRAFPAWTRAQSLTVLASMG
jgi:hypothetical protein